MFVLAYHSFYNTLTKRKNNARNINIIKYYVLFSVTSHCSAGSHSCSPSYLSTWTPDCNHYSGSHNGYCYSFPKVESEKQRWIKQIRYFVFPGLTNALLKAIPSRCRQRQSPITMSMTSMTMSNALPLQFIFILCIALFLAQNAERKLVIFSSCTKVSPSGIL